MTVAPHSGAANAARRLDRTIRLEHLPAPEVAGKRIATFRQAVRDFGQPTRLVARSSARPTCGARWIALGLEIDFSSARAGACTPPDLKSWVRVSVAAKPWHTVAGLHVGDPDQLVHNLYPQARLLDFLGQGHLWQLETGGLLCDGGPTLALAARITSRRVGALVVVRVPACG